MSSTALLWILATLGCITMHAFFTMVEMACVSFNKVRLEYFVAQKNRRAIWLNQLLQNPARLFGTTLLGVNVALQVGSECSRQVYEALNFHPDLAPITQVLIVLILAELSPMFAARRYPEHVAMLGVPIIYACSRVTKPIVWAIGKLSHMVNRLIGGRDVGSARFLSREELQNILQVNEDTDEGQELDVVVGNIFSLRRKTARQVMEPLGSVQMLPSNCSVGHMRQILRHAYYPYLPVYHRSTRNIVKIAYPRDLLNTPDNEEVRGHARPPWFVSQHTRVVEILQQFRQNKQSIAIVLDEKGLAVGILALDDILDEIFGEQEFRLADAIRHRRRSHRVIERAFPGTLRIEEFNKRYEANLESHGVDTIAQLMTKLLGHHPETGESIRVGDFQLTADETSLMGAKVVTIKTLIH